jgi:hypothetical protein
LETNQNPKTPNIVASKVKHNEMMNVHAYAMQCNAIMELNT